MSSCVHLHKNSGVLIVFINTSIIYLLDIFILCFSYYILHVKQVAAEKVHRSFKSRPYLSTVVKWGKLFSYMACHVTQMSMCTRTTFPLTQ